MYSTNHVLCACGPYRFRLAPSCVVLLLAYCLRLYRCVLKALYHAIRRNEFLMSSLLKIFNQLGYWMAARAACRV